MTDRIMTDLALDVPPTDYSPRNRDLGACLLASRRLSTASLAVLYRHVTFPHGRVFSKFLRMIEEHPALGRLTRRLDLSHFSSLGLGRSRQANGATQNFTRASFRRCLELMPNLKEVLLQEHVENDTDEAVLQKIFALPHLRALDFCGMSAGSFVDGFTATMAARSTAPLGIQNLCLHECSTLHSTDIEALLGRLPRLRILDLHHSQVTDAGLRAIPASAALTHLNLGRCTQLSGAGVVDFLLHHPATTELVYLNLGCDVARYRLLREADVDALLPALPTTLRSLNLNGAAFHDAHLPHLVRLAQHCEELSLSHTSLAITDVRALVNAEPRAPSSALRYLDLTGVASATQANLFAHATSLFGDASLPLEVVELSPALVTSLGKAKATNARLGWTTEEFGRRSWYVRKTPGGVDAEAPRAWKMGTRWWGMRKVPVAWSDVGGIYGHYMFKAGSR